MAEIYTTDLGTVVTWWEGNACVSQLFQGHAQHTVISAIVCYVKHMDSHPVNGSQKPPTPVSRL